MQTLYRDTPTCSFYNYVLSFKLRRLDFTVFLPMNYISAHKLR